jgi:hypothetical protein
MVCGKILKTVFNILCLFPLPLREGLGEGYNSNMKKKQITYSINQVKEKMEKYLDVSQERLRERLRAAWKKQPALKGKAYDRLKA